MENLARAYFEVGNRELCKLYFNRAVDLMIEQFGARNPILIESFRKSGLKIYSLQQLKELNPWMNDTDLIGLFRRIEGGC